MNAPIIGITTFHSRQPDRNFDYISVTEMYVRALVQAGAIPILVPLGLPLESLHRLLATLDGLLLSGGGDLDPTCYGGQPNPLIENVDAERDRTELILAAGAAEQGMPVLGICRGLQILNVALGGTLHADIRAHNPQALKHDYFEQAPRQFLAHEVRVEPGSRLASIMNGSLARVNSGHHQAIASPGAGLQITACAPDGTVEALELPGHPFGLAVQWHPEWLTHLPAQAGIFTAFVEAAASHR